jgi:hypothetical protein
VREVDVEDAKRDEDRAESDDGKKLKEDVLNVGR